MMTAQTRLEVLLVTLLLLATAAIGLTGIWPQPNTPARAGTAVVAAVAPTNVPTVAPPLSPTSVPAPTPTGVPTKVPTVVLTLQPTSTATDDHAPVPQAVRAVIADHRVWFAVGPLTLALIGGVWALARRWRRASARRLMAQLRAAPGPRPVRIAPTPWQQRGGSVRAAFAMVRAAFQARCGAWHARVRARHVRRARSSHRWGAGIARWFAARARGSDRALRLQQHAAPPATATPAPRRWLRTTRPEPVTPPPPIAAEAASALPAPRATASTPWSATERLYYVADTLGAAAVPWDALLTHDRPGLHRVTVTPVPATVPPTLGDARLAGGGFTLGVPTTPILLPRTPLVTTLTQGTARLALPLTHLVISGPQALDTTAALLRALWLHYPPTALALALRDPESRLASLLEPVPHVRVVDAAALAELTPAALVHLPTAPFRRTVLIAVVVPEDERALLAAVARQLRGRPAPLHIVFVVPTLDARAQVEIGALPHLTTTADRRGAATLAPTPHQHLAVIADRADPTQIGAAAMTLGRDLVATAASADRVDLLPDLLDALAARGRAPHVTHTNTALLTRVIAPGLTPPPPPTVGDTAAAAGGWPAGPEGLSATAVFRLLTAVITEPRWTDAPQASQRGITARRLQQITVVRLTVRQAQAMVRWLWDAGLLDRATDAAPFPPPHMPIPLATADLAQIAARLAVTPCPVLARSTVSMEATV